MYTLPDVQDHVFSSKFIIKHALFSQCIDGRYLREDNQACSIPGADIGQLGVMIAVTKKLRGEEELNENNIKILGDILIDVVGGVRHLHFHTDDHALHDHGIGCGHFKLCSISPEKYMLTKNEIHAMNAYMKKNIAHGAKNIILEGKHKEEGIIIIDSPTHSIHNQDIQGRQVFIFHKTCVENRNELIAEKMIESGLLDTDDTSEVAELLNQIMEEHLNITAGALAKGLPIFLVEINEDGENISQIGEVQ